jgi:tellurite resistance protein TerC
MTEEQKPPSGGSIRAILKGTKRLIVAVIGSTVILFGVALLVLPGPGLLVIGLGLAVLAAEFAWARRLLERGKGAAGALKDKLNNRKASGGS